MSRTEKVRQQIMQRLRTIPFRPFALIMESGDRFALEHPENIAFSPTANPDSVRGKEFFLTTGQVRMFCSFDAVTDTAIITPDK